MKNKNKSNAQRAKRKHAKNVARKGKGAQYGKSVSAFNQIKKLQRSHAISGIDSKHTNTDNDTTTFTDNAITKEITIA
jgi:hypothetical protein